MKAFQQDSLILLIGLNVQRKNTYFGLKLYAIMFSTFVSVAFAFEVLTNTFIFSNRFTV